MNDIDRHDADDQQMDRNLRAAARHLALPENPSPLQRARWKQGAMASGSTVPKKGILGMKRENFWRVLGAGGALAACITAAVVFGVGSARTVEAAAIFDSLREAIRKSLWIEIDDVSSEGMTANGRVLLVFNEQDGDASEASDNADVNLDDDVAASFVELRVTAAADHAEYPGLDLEAAIGMRPGDEWGFMQMHHIPDTLFTETPMLRLFAPMLNNGVVVDFDKLGLGERMKHGVAPGPGGGPSANFTFSSSSAGAKGADKEEDEKGTVLSLSFGTVPEGDESGEAEGDATVDHLNEHLHGLMFGADYHDDANSPEAQAALDEHMQMVKAFLTGRFTPELMETFIDHVESSAANTDVTAMADGSFLLRASGFDFGGHAGADDDLVLEIVYRKSTGIERVDLLNLGDGAGRLGFECSDADATAPEFDRTRYVTREGVRVIDGLNDLFGATGD